MKVEPSGLAPVLAVVIHDVAPPTWGDCRRLVAHLDAIDPRLRKTWLVVPRYHDHSPGPRMLDALARAAASGDELALHGWRHLDDGTPTGTIDRWMRRHYTAGEGEFAGLDATQAAQRLAAGRAWFAKQGWPPLRGFVPPAWLASEAALEQIERSGFDYTCSLGGLKVWKPGRAPDAAARTPIDLASQSVVYSTRSAWRRGLSLAWNAAVARREASRWLLRIELHPCDVIHASVRRSFTRIVEQALAHRESVTLAEAASRLVAWHDAPARVDRAAQPNRPPISTIAPPVNAPVSAPARTSPG